MLLSARHLFLVSGCALISVACGTENPSLPADLAAASPQMAPPVALEPAPAAPAPDPFAEEVIELTNAFRARYGLRPLKSEPRLAQAALDYSVSMGRTGHFDHTAPDGSTPWARVRAAGYPGGTVGENIAYGYKTPAQVMHGWIHSPGHRANLLRAAYREIGVGQAVSKQGVIYWTQNFGAR